MPKAPSNKKVARAASTGGSRLHRRTPWTYYSVIVVIAILGVLLTWSSRDSRLANINKAGTTQQPAVGAVWNEGYAVYECGKFLPAISSSKNPAGIHTSSPGDGIIHISPTVKSAAGKNATLGKFAGAVGMTINSAEIQTPGGKLYVNGDSCEGKAGHVYVKQFQSVGDTIGQLFNGAKNELPRLDPSEVPLVDQDLVTIAFVPANDASSIPPPPAYCGRRPHQAGPVLDEQQHHHGARRHDGAHHSRHYGAERALDHRQEMRAVVLVGGEGTRLRPLTLTTPKQMLPVGRRPMIERVLGHLAAHGIDEAVLSLGYRPDAFMQAYPDGSCAGVRLVYAVEAEPLDTAGAIRFAAVEAGLDQQGEAFVVVNGDVLTDLDVSVLVAFHHERQAEATIALTPVPDPSAFGVVPTDDHGRVQAFIEKPPRDTAPTNLINAGTYVLEPSVLARIPSDRRVSIERETFPALVADGRLYALGRRRAVDRRRYPGQLFGRQPGLRQRHRQCRRRRRDGRCRRDHRGLRPLRWCGDRRGAQVRSSIIGRGARVGANAVVADLSVVGDEAAVPPGATLSGQRFPAAE